MPRHHFRRRHREYHRTQHIGWLRAAVLGANDGVISTASLVIGVAASHATHGAIMVAGMAGLVAGAMSMAAGEYVSVSSQADTEAADVERERIEIASDEVAERKELAGIYVQRGLDADLAEQVAIKLMAKDALGAHARDELGIFETAAARPVQAAIASALAFSTGAALPLAVVTLAPYAWLSAAVFVASLLILAMLGIAAALIGGAPIVTSATRVTFWGLLAMVVTGGVGALFGTGP